MLLSLGVEKPTETLAIQVDQVLAQMRDLSIYPFYVLMQHELKKLLTKGSACRKKIINQKRVKRTA